jgi:hypothetical protein
MMRRILLFVACALAGCTIIPDDAFQKIPTASLDKITIQSNPEFGLGASLPSETLTGTVVTTPTKTTIMWAGELDPFYFVFPVEQLEYTFSTEKLLTGLTITSTTGYTITENFTYNASGNLLTATKAYEDYLYTHTFYYKNNVLDSIGKSVVHAGQTQTGFFKRFEISSSTVKFISVFPYNSSYPYSENSITGCSINFLQNDNDYNTTAYEFYNQMSVNQLYGMQLQISSPLFSNDQYYANSVSQTYFNINSTLIDTIVESFLTTQSFCSEAPKGALSPYLLLPERNDNYAILTMINAAEELYWLTEEPNRISNYVELKLTYDHTFAK